MRVELMYNKSDDRVVHKVVENVHTMDNVRLLDDTNITNPTLIIQGDINNINLKNINYLYILEFERSYHITNIEIISNNMIKLSTRVDVLMSFWDKIKDNDCIIRRQENKYNLYLDDGSFKAYQNPIKVTRRFPSGFSGSSYILSVVG